MRILTILVSHLLDWCGAAAEPAGKGVAATAGQWTVGNSLSLMATPYLHESVPAGGCWRLTKGSLRLSRGGQRVKIGGEYLGVGAWYEVLLGESGLADALVPPAAERESPRLLQCTAQREVGETQEKLSAQRGPDALTAAAERIVTRLLRDNKADRNYRADLTLEALLELAAVLDRPAWRAHVFSVLERRGLKPDSAVPYRSQPFGCLTFAVYRATGDQRWLPEFLRESERCRLEHPRSPEGAILHPRGAQRGGGVAVLIDAMQEYAARMARAGAITADADWYRDCAAQVRIYRSILRDPQSGLWSQGRGWIAGQPERLSPGAWSRGHGWLLRGLTAALAELPRGSTEFRELQGYLCELAEALLPRQLPGGLWPTLLHRPPAESPPDSSGSAMIATALSRAWREGWLKDPKARDAAQRAFAALSDRVNDAGEVLSVSPGPGPLESEADYLVAEFPPGNDHGPFSILFAAAEAARLSRHAAN